MERLKVYPAGEHPHTAQLPQTDFDKDDVMRPDMTTGRYYAFEDDELEYEVKDLASPEEWKQIQQYVTSCP